MSRKYWPKIRSPTSAMVLTVHKTRNVAMAPAFLIHRTVVHQKCWISMGYNGGRLACMADSFTEYVNSERLCQQKKAVA